MKVLLIGLVYFASLPIISANSSENSTAGSCLSVGYTSCCTVTSFNSCHGSDSICHCNAECYDYGDCCEDIIFLNCTLPTITSSGEIGPCQAAGYEQCCHPYNQNGTSCYGSPQTCYCDALCYSFKDCCEDVESIGCLEPNNTNPTPGPGSCVAAGYNSSCCVPSDTQSCLGYPETCHCDAICHEYGDCCSDVIDIGCFGQTGSCTAAGRTSCCLNNDMNCTGTHDNCFCDQGCFERDDCCKDIGKLHNCHHSGPNEVPGPVINLQTHPQSDNGLTVTWNPPIALKGANSYSISLRNYTETPYDVVLNSSNPIAVTQYTFQGLEPYTPYNITVFAVNNFGKGNKTTVVGFTKEGTPNVAPQDIRVVRLNEDTITVSWTPLNYSESQGIPIGYQITYSSITNDSITTVAVDGGTTHSYFIAGLHANKVYRVKLAGVTQIGVGVTSEFVFEEGLSSTVSTQSATQTSHDNLVSSTNHEMTSESHTFSTLSHHVSYTSGIITETTFIASSSSALHPSTSASDNNGGPIKSHYQTISNDGSTVIHPSSSLLISTSATSSNGPGSFWSQTNYKLVLGVSFGSFGLLCLCLLTVLAAVLILRKRKRKRVVAQRYRRLVFLDENEDDDDE